MRETDSFAPRSLLVRPTITVEISPSELHKLIRQLEADALAAIEAGLDGYPDYLLQRIAQLREAGR